MAQPASFVSSLRQKVRDMLTAIDDLRAAKAEYDALGADTFLSISSTVPGGGGIDYTQSDMSKADVESVLSSMGALDVWLATGHGTNFNKAR